MWWDSVAVHGDLERALIQVNTCAAATWPDDAGHAQALLAPLRALLDAYRRASGAAHSSDTDALNRASLPALQTVLWAVLDFPNTRLAAYGTLAPGESNQAQLADVAGTWTVGTVQGRRFQANGYPAFQPGEGQVPVSVLTSSALPQHWARLDQFEGADYRRMLIAVTLASGARQVAYLYEYIGSGGAPSGAKLADDAHP